LVRMGACAYDKAFYKKQLQVLLINRRKFIGSNLRPTLVTMVQATLNQKVASLLGL